MEHRKLVDLLTETFPIEPLPANFLWAGEKGALEGDIAQELRNRISGRRWTDVTLMDWRMIGTSPSISRLYLEPATFAYYLPSVILGVSLEIDYLEFVLEAMIPFNKNHVPRGRWWFEFSKSVTQTQRVLVSEFLADVRVRFWDGVEPANQELLHSAEAIWSVANQD